MTDFAEASSRQRRTLSRRSREVVLANPTSLKLRRDEGGDDARNFEPKARIKFEDLDKSIQKLRAIYKGHPEWFEVPKPKSDKGKNVVDYSIN